MADPEKAMVVEDGSDHEDVSSDDEAPAPGDLSAASLLQDPAVMAALQVLQWCILLLRPFHHLIQSWHPPDLPPAG